MATKKKKTYSGRSGMAQGGYSGGVYGSSGPILLGSQKVRSGAKSSKEYLVPRKTGSKTYEAWSTTKWDSYPNTSFRVNIKKGKKKKK